MSTTILRPAIPQSPSGDFKRTEIFFRDYVGFTEFELFAEHGQLIVRREPIEIHFWYAGSEEEAKKYGSASSCYIRV